jgi:hypothetical protein
MADQQDMLAYVKGRMAGTEAPPVPVPDPMKSYVVAQGARGALVPPTTMMDSPQYLVDPDVEAGPKARSNQQLDVDALMARKHALEKQFHETSRALDAAGGSGPEHRQLFKTWLEQNRQLSDMHEEFMAKLGNSVMRDKVEAPLQGVKDAQDIEAAMNARAAQPRQPLPPPAPGGVPLNAPPTVPDPSTVPMS